MTEAELLAEVTAQANDLGHWWHHCRGAVTCRHCGAAVTSCDGHPGLPDLLLVGDRAAMWAELKSEDGRRSRAQMHFGHLLRRAGQRYELWTPEDWRAGRVGELLREIA